MWKFPWISRASHDEIVAELRRELADRKEEARRIMDLFTQRATGQKIFYPDEPEAQKEPENLSEMEPMQRAQRVLGPKASLRDKLNFVEKENAKEFLSSRGISAVQPVPTEMESAMNQGRAAAKGTN